MTTNRPASAVLIAGPTASGKSALALELAQKRGGVIINADSMQVYRELSILTARPSADDEALAPHLLYGHVAGVDGYSAGRFCTDAAAAIATVQAQGKLPIIVGGTGLYFRALLQGLSPIPDVPPDIRKYWRDRGAQIGARALHAQLQRRDAVMAAKLQPTDPQRLMRALEVLEATGKSLSEWQAMPGTPVLHEEQCERLLVMPERAVLYERCDARFELMMGRGAVDEVRGLLQLNLDRGLPVMRVLGVAPIIEYMEGRIHRGEAKERAKIETRQFAKRQLTWLRKNMIAWKADS